MVLAEDLRQAVLQIALQGKLTKQLETDSSVDEMLKNMQEEKKKLIVEKKLKSEKALPKIQEEEIPFDIPDNWRWVRLGEVVKNISAGGDKPKNFSKEKTKLFSIPVIANGETNDGILGYTDEAILKEKSLTVSGRGTIGFSVVRTEPYVPIVRLLVITPLRQTNLYYIQCVLKSLVEIGIGTAVKQLTVPMIQPKTIPLPPIEEQQRIVDKINEIMLKIDEYEKIEKELEALKKEFPTNMKDALLQAAVQGKLTEQLESDNSVDELLEVMRKEKEELITQKKIKKEKALPDIEEEEIPFDIPENWRWERVGNICDCGAGATPTRSDRRFYDNGTVFWLKTGELTDGYINQCEEKISQIALKKCSLRLNKEGDVLIAMYGATIGKLGIVTFPLTTNQACCGCSPYTGVYNLYLFYYLMSSKKTLVGKAEGGAQPNISREKIRNFLMPVPPIEEQHRIVERLEALLPLCEDLKEA